jgi:hypothetical protein
LKGGRDILIARYRELDPDGSTDIFLSGGVDSATMLFAALENGFRPHCITFHLEGVSSSDLRVATAMTKELGVRHTIVTIPRSLDVLIDDVHRVMKDTIDWSYMADVSSRLIQVMHPVLYLVPAMRGPAAMLGMGGDVIAATSRAAGMVFSAEGEFGAWGLRSYKAFDPASSGYLFDRFAAKSDKRVHEFYHSPEIVKWARSMTLREFNRPRQKQALVACFPEYWRRGKWYRENSPYQINSGLRVHHNLLLKTKYNTSGFTKVIGCYRAIGKTMGLEFGARAASVDCDAFRLGLTQHQMVVKAS